MNHLEQLVSEWLEFKGYFVKSCVSVGPRQRGGFEGELALALRGKSIPEISQETGIPTKSLYDIKANGPYSHRNRAKSAP